jgi:hypothetical protein
MPISLKTKTIFHCRCVHEDCLHEWDADRKPRRCARCKRRSWNGEDHRFQDPWDGVPVASQIKTGTKVPRPPSNEAMLDTFTKAKGVIEETIRQNPCDHKKDQCVCAEKELLANIAEHIERLSAMRPLRSTYLVQREPVNA